MNQIVDILPINVRTKMKLVDLNELQEIRLRAGKEIYIMTGKGMQRINHVLSYAELQETLDYISNYSLYAYEKELSQGFLTIRGGHRVGVAGQVVMEQGKIKNFSYISSINIRIAHEVKGCANKVVPYLKDKEKILSTLIISSPGNGKTTMLRDIVRLVSQNKQVSVIDERSEIGACYHGIPQNDLGVHVDVLDGCTKAEGMVLMLRTMRPDVIVLDEIGTENEMKEIAYVMNAGVSIIATTHGGALEEIMRKMVFQRARIQKWFQRYVVLKNVGELDGIYDGEGNRICG